MAREGWLSSWHGQRNSTSAPFSIRPFRPAASATCRQLNLFTPSSSLSFPEFGPSQRFPGLGWPWAHARGGNRL